MSKMEYITETVCNSDFNCCDFEEGCCCKKQKQIADEIKSLKNVPK